MATTITVDTHGVHIPLEAFDTSGEGVTVVTLAQGAYLIIRADILASYPRQRLRALSGAAQALIEERHLDEVVFTTRKQRALQDLRQAGYQVSDGLEYGLQAMATHKVSLEEVRQGLAAIPDSLAADVIAERDAT